MSTDHAVFVLEHLKLQATIELEKRVVKHLKNEFYNKMLPKIINQLKNELVVDLVNNTDFLEIKMSIKPQEK